MRVLFLNPSPVVGIVEEMDKWGPTDPIASWKPGLVPSPGDVVNFAHKLKDFLNWV